MKTCLICDSRVFWWQDAFKNKTKNLILHCNCLLKYLCTLAEKEFYR